MLFLFLFWCIFSWCNRCFGHYKFNGTCLLNFINYFVRNYRYIVLGSHEDVMEWSIFPALSGFWLIWWYYFPFCVVLETLRNLKLKLWTKHCPHTVLSPLFQMNKCRRCRDGDVTHLHAYTHTHMFSHMDHVVLIRLWTDPASLQSSRIRAHSPSKRPLPPTTLCDITTDHDAPADESSGSCDLSLYPPGTSCKIISFSQNKEERF